jgi:hypothetical protein
MQHTREIVPVQHYSIRCLRQILYMHHQGDELAPTTDLEAQTERPAIIEEHKRCGVVLAEVTVIEAVVDASRNRPAIEVVDTPDQRFGEIADLLVDPYTRQGMIDTRAQENRGTVYRIGTENDEIPTRKVLTLAAAIRHTAHDAVRHIEPHDLAIEPEFDRRIRAQMSKSIPERELRIHWTKIAVRVRATLATPCGRRLARAVGRGK